MERDEDVVKDIRTAVRTKRARASEDFLEDLCSQRVEKGKYVEETTEMAKEEGLSKEKPYGPWLLVSHFKGHKGIRNNLRVTGRAQLTQKRNVNANGGSKTGDKEDDGAGKFRKNLSGLGNNKNGGMDKASGNASGIIGGSRFQVLAEDDYPELNLEGNSGKDRRDNEPSHKQKGALTDISNKLNRKGDSETKKKVNNNKSKLNKGKGTTIKKGGIKISGETGDEIEDSEVMAYLHQDITAATTSDQPSCVNADSSIRKVNVDQAVYMEEVASLLNEAMETASK
ncbi:hypothetical protein ACOSP7_007901 [Xanthoceras sorbifolium]